MQGYQERGLCRCGESGLEPEGSGVGVSAAVPSLQRAIPI